MSEKKSIYPAEGPPPSYEEVANTYPSHVITPKYLPGTSEIPPEIQQSTYLPGTSETPSEIPQPTYSPGTSVPPLGITVAAQKMTWLERNRINKPQSNSVGGVSLLFIVAGMNMAWCAFSPQKENSFVWFIGAIVGAVVGAIINSNVKRNYLMVFSAALTFIDGILYLTSNNYCMTVGRFFDGLAIGVVFVPAMVLIGEESIKHLRGMLASCVELVCFYAGIGIQICYNQAMTNPVQMQGIMNLICGLIALAIVSLLYIESPVYHLQRNEEELAIDCLRRLQIPFIVTTETYVQLEDHKCYVQENNKLSLRQSVKQALPALGVLVLHRAWLAMTFSAITYTATFQVTTDGFVIMYGNLSTISALIGCFLMDSTGRRKPTLVGAVICSCFALAITLCAADVFETTLHTNLVTLTWLLIAYQFASPFSTLASSVYLTEAFPLAVKPYFICIPFVVQMLVQLIINCTCSSENDAFIWYFSASTVMSVTMALLAAGVLPETKKDSLLAAQNKFKLCGQHK